MRVVRVGELLLGRPSLAERGRFHRVFLGFGLFTEATLLFCGGYLIAGVMQRPLEAQAYSVVAGGVMLALATMLLLYLFWPNRKHVPRRPAEAPSEMLLTAYGNAVRARAEATRALADEDELPGPM
jgi:hypothetical protein